MMHLLPVTLLPASGHMLIRVRRFVAVLVSDDALPGGLILIRLTVPMGSGMQPFSNDPFSHLSCWGLMFCQCFQHLLRHYIKSGLLRQQLCKTTVL